MTSNKNNLRTYTAIDNLMLTIDQCMRAFNRTKTSQASYPADRQPHKNLTTTQQKKSASLMRVNHCGEVCAQALYLGQSLTARNQNISIAMQKAADEEIDHLVWCEKRLSELNNRTSYLNPVWFTGSLAIGVMAGFAGDKISLGFLAETENQVVKHLGKHLQLLPSADQRSRAILTQMKADEAEHAILAVQQGAIELPAPIKFTMRITSKIMTTIAHYI
jgi:ubiquinone biosynthesis monooxygenase Coq7